MNFNFWKKREPGRYFSDESLGSELFNSDQLESFGKSLAATHILSGKKLSDVLLGRLDDNAQKLLSVRQKLNSSLRANYSITPAGEWLVDNFYLIEEQILLAKKHLPKGYSEGLPLLDEEIFSGVPRVYDLALEVIAHTDGRLDIDSLNLIVHAYQTITTLKLGELWAVPIMLRLAIIENLRRLALRLADEREERDLADAWSAKLIKAAENERHNLILIIADMARSGISLSRAFVSELTRQLRGRSSNLLQVNSWIEERLSESGHTPAEMVQADNQRQAADQLTISNYINSLRALNNIDWRTFVEQNSAVEQILKQDGIYSKLDFATRDNYRHVIEHIGKHSKFSETEIAEIAIKEAQNNFNNNGHAYKAHVGYYLIDEGLEIVRHATKPKFTIGELTRKAVLKIPLTAYLLPIALITAIITFAILIHVHQFNYRQYQFVLIAIVAVISASQLAVSLVNLFYTVWLKPVLLPKMNFADGIPSEAKTLVAIPSMLLSIEEIDVLAEALEIRYLANKNTNLFFALVTDFKDADKETLNEDDELLNAARAKIEFLNHKYAVDNGAVFFLLHRPRLWNPSEGVWMGQERKRGKLADLNKILLGNNTSAFSSIVGNLNLLEGTKYVLTLDSDTQLPRDSAHKIIATIAHPLNKAVCDTENAIVTRGYGILQPRVAVSLPRTDSSAYAKLNGNEPGIDPYTKASSDIYQDLFKEGSFIGKGIYDVEVFEKVLGNRLPYNRILSHDLLEGNYTRSGLISDVQLFEKYPPRYMADLKRRHRWIRGDWQILPWFLPWVPDAAHHWHKNPLSGLSRWKIFDNIRRSLFPLAITMLILFGWLWLPLAGWWTLIVSGIAVLPAIITVIWTFIRKPRDTVFSHHLLLSGRSAGNTAISTMFTLICLPYEAALNLHAILLTIWRLVITRRHLLLWNPSSITDKLSPNSLLQYYLSMWFEPLLALAIPVYLYLVVPTVLEVASPILLLWLFAPVITWKVSQPLPVKSAELSPAQKILLQKYSRRIWRFFEELVVEGDNWLPPDNIQEEPRHIIAHRTSPTNIGLSLLSTLSAYDFGFIDVPELLERCRKTFDTLNKMERFKGHFYNWYDTQTLQPLNPHYVSTVDSGNMIGHIMTLKQGLTEIPAGKIVEQSYFESLRTLLRLLAESAGKNDFGLLRKMKIELETALQPYPDDLFKMCKALDNIKSAGDILLSQIPAANTDVSFWKEAMFKQLNSNCAELSFLFPLISEKNLSNELINVICSYQIPDFFQLRAMYETLTETYAELLSADQKAKVELGLKNVNARLGEIEALEQACENFINVDWDFLYNRNKDLLSIGYNVNDHRLDNSYYDLLASEARLAVFVAIAQGKIPQDCWFALGRHLLNVDNNPVLLSWSGSMFEYLMPVLVMPTYDNTLLDETYKVSVQKQIQYGRNVDVPWGFSESGYNMIDAAMNYQYHAFGVPGLGLKRGLGEDMVVAPYASVLALMVAPEKAAANLQRIQEIGASGQYGFYEALDYTPSRLSRNQQFVVVKSFMAHHQGMSLLSLASVLLGHKMQKRFEDEPVFASSLLLLEERIPKTTSFYVHTNDIADTHAVSTENEIRIIHKPDTPSPEVQLLSNGNYHLMLTAAGGGYSRWRGYALTRWREDTTSDNWGSFCYIRDVQSGEYWSTAFQPTLKKGKQFEVAFSLGRADYRQSFKDLEMHCEVVVSPEDDIELRRIHLTNRSGATREIDITTYAEVALALPDADLSHPAFSKLFVETRWMEDMQALLCKRRHLKSADTPPSMFHMVKVYGKQDTEISYETDRMVFLGRNNTTARPAALLKRGKLAGTTGAVLDPVVCIRHKIKIEYDETVLIDVITGAGESEKACTDLMYKYQEKTQNDRVFDLAWTHGQVVLKQLNASVAEAQLYTRLAGSILYLNPAMRADSSVLARNTKGQSGLWPYSISGDVPIVFVQIEDETNIEFVRHLVQAHGYWRLKGLTADLVICNESRSGYRQDLQDKIMEMVASHSFEKKGGIFVRSGDQISAEDKILFQSAARIHIVANEGTLADFVNRKTAFIPAIPLFNPAVERGEVYAEAPEIETNLKFNNGYGGFNQEANEYHIITERKRPTPLPWINVLANADFGTIISEHGQSYTWCENSHEFRLTPWSNDFVTDMGGETIYIRDEETGSIWSPLTAIDGKGRYKVRHGFGYSVIEHTREGIQTEVWVYVDSELPVKFSLVRLKNVSGKRRTLTVTGYVEWALGDLREKHSMFINCEPDAESGALTATNPYNSEFSHYAAFFATDELEKSFTINRTEFIGRNKSLQNPEGLLRERLSGRKTIGVDPCAAIQVKVQLGVNKEYDVVFKLGAAKNRFEAREVVKKLAGKDKAFMALEKTKKFWANNLSTIQVTTPDESLNILSNGWLPYQTLACRMWARTGFYQSSGAFGFRDQLQDSLALVHAVPELTRKQILLCASKQFLQGDVLHWWHPPVGRGIRTKCSDDFLWLPYAVAHYVKTTADEAVLDEAVSFVEGRLLDTYEHSNYDLPVVSNKTASLYEHCVLAIKHGFRYGQHGLPLIGTGDWNDGMDEVGKDGKGESVWLAFFLYKVLNDFIPIAAERKDNDFVDTCKREMAGLKRSIAESGWDGNWYRRAYFDDGSPLGSVLNEECIIDSIAQSWAIISEAGDKEKGLQGLEMAFEKLVDKDNRLIKLLTPPFDHSNLEPGYIKGYLPGVRENGGQYTHAAMWMIMALMRSNQNDSAFELLNLVNPVSIGQDLRHIDKYKGEPYVLAGDVHSYSSPGRAGWTWYTGSAGWAYRVIVEELLGIKLVKGAIQFAPHFPSSWNHVQVKHRYGATQYIFSFERDNSGTPHVIVDGAKNTDMLLQLDDGGGTHEVVIKF